jgi:hypothetical protein
MTVLLDIICNEDSRRTLILTVALRLAVLMDEKAKLRERSASCNATNGKRRAAIMLVVKV